MKKQKITEEQAKKSPAGGVLVGKRDGQTIIHDKGTEGGYFVGKLHKEGGIKGINKSTGQPIEVQGGEVIITAPAVADQTKREFEGEMLTNREILSKINEKGGGVSLENGGEIYFNGSSYNYGGKTMTDYEIMQSMSDCGCEHEYKKGGVVTYRDKYNRKFKYPKGTSHDLEQISKDTKISIQGLQKIYNKGIGAYKTNPESVRPNVKSKEQWAMARVYSAVMGGKASKVDSNELKMNNGGNLDLAKESKKGDHTSRDLNNYNDLLDIQADGMAGSATGLYEDGGNVNIWNKEDVTIVNGDYLKRAEVVPSYKDDTMKGRYFVVFRNEKGKIAYSKDNFETYDLALKYAKDNVNNNQNYANGGDLDFLDEAVKKFDDGGATKELVEYIKIWSTGSSLSSLYGNEYENYKDLKKDLEEINPRYSYIYLAPNGKSMGGAIDVKKDGKNTVKTINPTTSKAKDFEKVMKRSWGDWRFEKYDLSNWLKEDGKRTPKPQPQPKKEELGIDLAGKHIIVYYDKELATKVVKRAEELGWVENDAIKGRIGSNDIPKYLFFASNNYVGWGDDAIGEQLLYEDLFKKGEAPKKELITDLSNTKIWIGDNPELSRKIQKRAFELGWSWASGKEVNPTNIDGLFFENDKRIFKNYDGRLAFDSALEREIFVSDLFGDEEPTKPEPQPEPTKEEARIDFEATKKYLTLRIADLTKELNFKKPRLSNEEIGFYQRDINELIFKLRKINEKELGIIPIKDRLENAYSLKWGDINAEFTPSKDLLAPNGLPTKLTDEEWLNVRTDYFSTFFGDWRLANEIGDFSGVSKVIDPETKEPMPVYHGTNVLFTEWKTYKTNNAHYFAKNRDFSQWFAEQWSKGRGDISAKDSNLLKQLNPNKGEYLYRCFLDIKNPIDFSRFGVEKRPVSDFLMFLQINYNIGDFDFWTNFRLFNNLAQDTLVYSWMIIRNWQSFTEYVKMATTYDGYIFYEYHPEKVGTGLDGASLSYCAFDSNQIKFTTATEFNALITDSRFEQGGKL